MTVTTAIIVIAIGIGLIAASGYLAELGAQMYRTLYRKPMSSRPYRIMCILVGAGWIAIGGAQLVALLRYGDAG